MAGVAYNLAELLRRENRSSNTRWIDAVYNRRTLYERGHGYLPLRSGCMSSAHDIGRLKFSTLAECVFACSKQSECGAVAFFRIPGYFNRLGKVQRYNDGDTIGFCQKRHVSCTLAARQGTCKAKYSQELKNGWCSYLLLPAHDCRLRRYGVTETNVSFAFDDLAFRTRAPLVIERPNPSLGEASSAAAVGAAPHLYRVASKVLGGGLNNMLMHVAQLIQDTCGSDKQTLILPELDADPLCAQQYGERARRTCNRTLAFGQVFDAVHFIKQLAPCKLIEAAPLGGTTRVVEVTKLNRRWKGSPMLDRVYSAARPSLAVRRITDALLAEASRVAGARWSAVHLPIERDWWWVSDFCHPRSNELFTRRCFAPAEVANYTTQTRRALKSTGAVLMYASDKVAPEGPPLCSAQFGTGAFKLRLPERAPYTIRNAAEQFFAAEAPAGFFGNAFSTFSKGVALMRSMRAEKQTEGASSFAYDCALAQIRWWPRDGGNRSILKKHPGFSALKTLREARARCRFV